MADVMEAMCSPSSLPPSLGLAETLHELTSKQGILYDTAVVEACLRLFGQDLADFGAASVEVTPLSVRMPDSQVLPDDGAGAQGNFAHMKTLPEAAAAKPSPKAKLRPLGYRSWLQIGSASLLGWLIMASVSSLWGHCLPKTTRSTV